jgi:phospholipid-binding lipoprotein MlaA
MLAIQLCVLVFSKTLCYWPERIRDRGIAIRHQGCASQHPLLSNHRRSAKMPTNAPTRLIRHFAVALSIAISSGCATAPEPSDTESYAEFRAINDPLEPLNRTVFGFNRALDAMFLRPFADFYRLLLPPPFQRGVHNFLANLRSPVILVNDLLQGEWERAGTTTRRFIVNTTVGVGGLGDPASDFGFPAHNEDFGQTLAVWGLPEGPFLMLPVIGPSNPRDATGLAVDSLIIDPLGLLNTMGAEDDWLPTFSLVRFGMTAIDTRAQNIEELDDLEKSSLDFYAAIRSLYRQFRTAEIHQGQPPPGEQGPSLDDFPAIPLE